MRVLDERVVVVLDPSKIEGAQDEDYLRAHRYIYVFIYYIYIERESEGGRERGWRLHNPQIRVEGGRGREGGREGGGEMCCSPLC